MTTKRYVASADTVVGNRIYHAGHTVVIEDEEARLEQPERAEGDRNLPRVTTAKRESEELKALQEDANQDSLEEVKDDREQAEAEKQGEGKGVSAARQRASEGFARTTREAGEEAQAEKGAGKPQSRGS